MNKVIISALMACGLLLLDSPEAAAHEERISQERWSGYDSHDRKYRESHSREYYARERHRDYYRSDYYGAKYKRAPKMPRWLKHNRSFRHWYKHTRLRKNRYMSWHQLFDIYRWEFSYARYRKH